MTADEANDVIVFSHSAVGESVSQLKAAPGSTAPTVNLIPGPDRPHLSERGSAVSIMLPSDAEAHNGDAWTSELRRQARIALRVAATSGSDDRTLGYYVRAAVAHGLTIIEVCRAAHLSDARVLELTDPAVAG